MRVSLVQYGVMTYPPGMEGWGMFRIEYGGHAESCITEGLIWLPPWIDRNEWEARMRHEFAGPRKTMGMDAKTKI